MTPASSIAPKTSPSSTFLCEGDNTSAIGLELEELPRWRNCRPTPRGIQAAFPMDTHANVSPALLPRMRAANQRSVRLISAWTTTQDSSAHVRKVQRSMTRSHSCTRVHKRRKCLYRPSHPQGLRAAQPRASLMAVCHAGRTQRPAGVLRQDDGTSSKTRLTKTHHTTSTSWRSLAFIASARRWRVFTSTTAQTRCHSRLAWCTSTRRAPCRQGCRSHPPGGCQALRR